MLSLLAIVNSVLAAEYRIDDVYGVPGPNFTISYDQKEGLDFKVSMLEDWKLLLLFGNQPKTIDRDIVQFSAVGSGRVTDMFGTINKQSVDNL